MDLPIKPRESAPILDDPEWNEARSNVNKNPSSLPAWDVLISKTEKLALQSPVPDTTKELIKQTFDELLTKYPLLFGYWRRYASIEAQLGDDKKAVLARAVESFPNSLDLWLDYVNVLQGDLLNQAFERGAECVGRQFLSHPFWDKYIEHVGSVSGEVSAYERNVRVFKAHLRIIGLPLHQYARYAKAFLEAKRRFTPEQLLELDPELKTIQGDLKKGIEAHYGAVFASTARKVAERWPFESKFTPVFFSPTPLKQEELENFMKYLEFEESQGDLKLACSLYERVLVPCALYEVFWTKYINFLTKKDPDNVQRIKEVYSRAIGTFLPLEKSFLRMNFLLFLEKIGDLQQVNDYFMLYMSLYRDFPDMSRQIFTKYLGFLQRNTPDFEDNVENALSRYFPSLPSGSLFKLDPRFEKMVGRLNDRLACVLINKHITNQWRSPPEKMVQLFSKIQELQPIKSDEQFWVWYFNYTKHHRLYSELKKMMKSLREETLLAPLVIDRLTVEYILYLESNSGLIAKDLGLSPTIIQKEIMATKAELGSSAVFKRSMESRVGDYYKNLWRSNGNIGFSLEDRPTIVNPISWDQSLEKAPPVPSFKNVERAGVDLMNYKLLN